jgi:SAM-dependent methyltransferase
MQKIDVNIEGLDVLVRDKTYISVNQFDGKKIPFQDNSFDTVIVIDVLHHTDDPKQLMREMKRVAKKNILIKDHTLSGFLAKETLKLMDYVGNSHYGVRLPYNYLTENEWTAIFKELNLTVHQWEDDLHLYPMPWTWLFDRKLHFIANLTV